MPEVVCEQLLYACNTQTLEGSSNGTVLRSNNWPGKLGLAGGTLDKITAGPPPNRVQAFSIKVANGTLFGVRSKLVDVGGAPNYCVHMMFDPSGQIGLLDTIQLAVDGWFVSHLAGQVTPSANWEQLAIKIGEEWPKQLTRGVSPEIHDDDQLRFLLARMQDPPQTVAGAYDALVRIAPAPLVNGLSLVTDNDPNLGITGAYDSAGVVNTFGPLANYVVEAVHRNAPKQWVWWWRRTYWSVDEWVERLRMTVLALTSPQELDDQGLVDIAQKQPKNYAPYIGELLTRLEKQNPPFQLPVMEDWLSDELLVAAVERNSPIALHLANDTQLLEMVKSELFGAQLPTMVIQRLAVMPVQLPGAVLRQMMNRPDFWSALQHSSPERQQEVANWLLQRGGFRVPDWFAELLLPVAKTEYSRFFGKMSAPDAYDRLFSMVGDAGAIEVMTNSEDLYAWSLALAKRGQRQPSDLQPAITMFNKLAAESTGLAELRLVTNQTITYTKTALIALGAGLGIALIIIIVLLVF